MICIPVTVSVVGAPRLIGYDEFVLTAWLAVEPLSPPHAASDALITTAATSNAAVPLKPTLIIPATPCNA